MSIAAPFKLEQNSRPSQEGGATASEVRRALASVALRDVAPVVHATIVSNNTLSGVWGRGKL